ncbi:MAG: leucine-rich repeat domain-containing protein [Sedimentisphaerales bacterium]|nr:leucine-rich repeat domain-containing protein [Sedimentisphaerales bacterium]
MRRLLIALALALLLVRHAQAEDPVYFADANLKTAVETALWIWDPTPTDLLELTWLSASNQNIGSVTGLEYATNLQSLDLPFNSISDISALSGLTNLWKLVLNNNEIYDLSPVAGLTNLEHLDVHGTHRIQDISAVSGLVNLQTLVLRINCIGDISALSGLTALEDLDLQWNSITSISSLSGLTNLRRVQLQYNQIEDVSPLSALTSLERLDLRGNPLNAHACEVYIPLILANNPGIELKYDRCVDGYRLWLSSTAGGSVAIPGEGEFLYANGQTVEITAQPEDGYVFVGWSGSQSHTINPICLSMHQDLNLQANFAPVGQSDPPVQHQVSIHSALGGSIIMPGEGSFTYDEGQTVILKAQAEPGFVFVTWSGSFKEAANPALLAVYRDHDIEAVFSAARDAVYVDANAPADPAPDNSKVSDPDEDGTAEHPFDRIQEAIDRAADGAAVIVRPGRYQETINLRGKDLQLTGLDPGGTQLAIIDGDGAGPVVSFLNGEGPECLLAGFVITGGRDEEIGAVVCTASRPTIANCLIVGNHATSAYGAAVRCRDSPATFVNCTLVDNTGGLLLIDSDAVLANSIVWDTLALAGTSQPAITYCDVAGGWPGTGNINADPLFAQPGCWTQLEGAGVVWVEGDYHLKSQTGRWDPKVRAWIKDEVTSPCIDAGRPADPVEPEPLPHGDVINLGAYGGTIRASMSRSP